MNSGLSRCAKRRMAPWESSMQVNPKVVSKSLANWIDDRRGADVGLVGIPQTVKSHWLFLHGGTLDMSIHVAERRMDTKRRVTIPSRVHLKAGSKVFIVSSTDSA